MRAGSGSMSLLADLVFPESFVWGEYAAAAMADAQAARDYFASGSRRRRFEPRRRGDGVRLGWRPAGRCLAGRAGRGRVQPSADVERGDAPHRRGARLRDAAAGRDEGAPPVPAERPPGRAGRVRALARLLDVPAGSRQPADQHLLRQRPRSTTRSTSRNASTSRPRSRRRRSPRASRARWSASRSSPSSRCSGWRWRVHRRGRFGRKASATLRSLYPIVLGLGGWFLGVLIVITTMPGVPLDDELLAVLSVGVPVGLGIYWAWVHRDWSAGTQERRGSWRQSQARSPAPGSGSTRRPTCWRSSPRSSGRQSAQTWRSSPSTSPGSGRLEAVSRMRRKPRHRCGEARPCPEPSRKHASSVDPR